MNDLFAWNITFDWLVRGVEIDESILVFGLYV